MPKVQVNGMTMHYEVRGEGKPIVFLHGQGTCWRMWEPQVEAVSRHFQMIMVDLRGHGESSRDFPNDRYSPYLCAQDVKCLLDELKLDKVYLLGLSQGGVVAELLSMMAPERIEKLVLSNTYSEMPTKAAAWILHVSNFIFSLLPMSVIVKLMMKVYRDDTATQDLIRGTLTIDKKMMLMMNRTPLPNCTNELHRITCPTLVMGGDGKMAGVDERRGSTIIFEHIPNAALALFKNAFDPLSSMRRDVFNDMVVRFFRGDPLLTYDGVRYLTK